MTDSATDHAFALRGSLEALEQKLAAAAYEQSKADREPERS
jgi:hypothetical protein